MGLSNYPPGVTGNEPQISGIWPAEVVVDEAYDNLKRIHTELEDIANNLEDQLGELPRHLEKIIEEAVDSVEDWRDNLSCLLR